MMSADVAYSSLLGHQDRSFQLRGSQMARGLSKVRVQMPQLGGKS